MTLGRRLALPLLLALAASVFYLPPGPGTTGAAAVTPRDDAESPLRRLLAERSTLTAKYQRWRRAYVEAGGDAEVSIRLAPVGQAARDMPKAEGVAAVDLHRGRVEVSLRGLDRERARIRLVDARRNATLEVGLARLENGAGVVSREFGDTLFRDFELDRIVVSEAGAGPGSDALLAGRRPVFERLYTLARTAGPRTRQVEGWTLEGLTSPAGWLGPRAAHANGDILVDAELVSQLVFDGGDLFFRGTFGGNGRTCATCHPVTNNQTIDPAFIAALPSNDPLFVATNPGGVPMLERPNLLSNFALILENVDTFDDPTELFVMRSVPHTLSLAATIEAPPGPGPADRTGWSADGSPTGDLLGFSAGAVKQHFTTDLARVPGVHFQPPTPGEEMRMELFMLASGRLEDIDINALTFTDTVADEGRAVFLDVENHEGMCDPFGNCTPAFTGGKCRFCHNDAGANVAGDNLNFDTGVEQLVTPARVAESFPVDEGFGPAVDTDDDGVYDDFGDGTFNTAPLIEAADTGPFFHNNAFDTLEEAIAFYDSATFNASPDAPAGGIDLRDEDPARLGAFLRVLNAAFNIGIAEQRSDAAASLIVKPSTLPCIFPECPPPPPDPGPIVVQLLSLANLEALDAVDVLSVGPLGGNATTLLLQAVDLNEQAIAQPVPSLRKQKILQALAKLGAARAELGTGLVFELGEGNLLF